MRTLLAALSVWLALPALALAANVGDSCHFTQTTVTPGVTAPNIQLPTLTKPFSAPQVLCTVLLDQASSGAVTAGPVWVPGGGQYGDEIIIRAVAGTSTSGCGYDDVGVYELSTPTFSGDAERTLLGTLDDDGTLTGGATTGVHEIKVFGPVGPYVMLDGGTAGTGGTCSSTHHLQIQMLVYPKAAIGG